MMSVAKKEEPKMTSENFCYWLQGLLELTPDLTTLNAAQVKMVRDHLGYVFTHMAPKAATTPPGNFDLRKALEAQQAVTNPAIGQQVGSFC